jgi:uncharacterized protein
VIESAPLPELDSESRPFWEGCARGELLVQACGSCGRRRFPPRPMCPACRSMEQRWEPAGETGTVWSFAVPHPPLLPAFQPYAPYVVAVVALDSDPAIRLVGNLVSEPGADIGSVRPEQVRIGAPVRVTFGPATEDVALPQWVLV